MRWERRHARWAGAVLLVVTAFGGLWWGWLAGRVTRRAEAELERRTGLAAHIGDVDLGLGGFTLEEVRLGARDGALSVSLDEVFVGVGLWKAMRGVASPERLELHGGRVEIDFGDPEIDAVVQRLRQGRAEGATSVEGAAQPQRSAADGPEADGNEGLVIEATDLHVLARDRHGLLGEALEMSVKVEAGSIRIASKRLRLGSDDGDRASLERAFVSAERSSVAGLRLTSLSSERGEVHWAAPVGSGDEDGSARETALSERMRNALRHLASPESDEEPDEEPASGGIFARLSPDIRVDLGDLTFHGKAPDGSATTIRFTELLLGRTDDGRLESIGAGDGGDSGNARWKLLFDPATARAEGDLRFDALPITFVAPLVPFVPLHPTPDGKLSADLRLRVTESSTVEIEGRVAVTNAALSSPRIADHPVTGVTVSLDGSGVWHPAEKRLVWRSGHLRSGEVEVRLSGELAVTDEAYRVRFESTLPPTDCQAVIDAIPRDVLGPVASFQLAGTLGGRAVVRVDSRKLRDSEVEIDVDDGCEFIAVPEVAEIYRFEGPFAHQVVEPDGSVFTMTTGPSTSSWAPFGTIHRNVVTAILSHEDASFYRHSGFAPWAIREALIRNLEAGAFRYGASTISMQLTKNLFLRREKTLVRKVQEVFFTWWLERALEKPRILELYLNVIEYGPGIYGIRNATRHYFGREPSDVSPAEAAFLANVLPSPKRYGAMYLSGAPSASMIARMGQFLRHVHARGRMGDEALAHGLRELPGLRFHREGSPPPPPRALPGDAAAAQYGEGREEPSEDEWGALETSEGG